MLCMCVCGFFFFFSCCKELVVAMAVNKASHLEKNPDKELNELEKMKVITLYSPYFCFVCFK